MKTSDREAQDRRTYAKRLREIAAELADKKSASPTIIETLKEVASGMEKGPHDMQYRITQTGRAALETGRG